jgi:hypothetical protein
VNGWPLDDYADEMPEWTSADGWLTPAQAEGLPPGRRWVALLVASDLPSRAKHVGMVVEFHCHRDQWHCWHAFPVLAIESGSSEATVSRAVRDLAAVGFLAVERPGAWNGHRPTTWLWLCWPRTEPRRASMSEAGEARLAAKRERQARYEKRKAGS